jgi:hypothetical protein
VLGTCEVIEVRDFRPRLFSDLKAGKSSFLNKFTASQQLRDHRSAAIVSSAARGQRLPDAVWLRVAAAATPSFRLLE